MAGSLNRFELCRLVCDANGKTTEEIPTNFCWWILNNKDLAVYFQKFAACLQSKDV